MSKITVKILRDMEADRSKGDSFAEIAARYGLKADFVRNRTKHIQPVKRVFLEDKAEEILLLIGLGHSQSEVARQLGVAPSSINKALARMEWKAAA
jgi:DNA-binding CsgD family transcriptional regulator